jgi:hypothetical protein
MLHSKIIERLRENDEYNLCTMYKSRMVRLSEGVEEARQPGT